MRLADGNEWTVPLVHARCEGETVTTLPRTFRVGPGGEPSLEPDAHYAELCRDARTLFDCVYGESDDPWPFTELQTGVFATNLLAVNYRVGLHEVSMLGLLDTLCLFKPLQAAIGLMALTEDQQAKNSDGPVVGA